MRSAMTRRTPITLISVVSGEAGDAPKDIALIERVSGCADGGPEDSAPDDVGPNVSAETCRDPAPGPGPVDGLAAARLSAAGKSPRKRRPPGPEPAMVDKSIPASRARRRLAGEAFTRPWLCRSAGSPSPRLSRPGSGRPGSAAEIAAADARIADARSRGARGGAAQSQLG